MMCEFEDTEALRLLRSFYKIRDPDIRHAILAITEASARGNGVGREQSRDESVQIDHLTS